MIGRRADKLRGGPWFEDLADGSFPYRRRSHDQDPADDYKLVMMFDPQGLVRAREAGLSEMVTLTLAFDPARVRDDRMPEGEALTAVYAAMDDSFDALFSKARMRARLIGTQTGNGQRVYFLMVSRAADAVALLNAMPAPEFVQPDAEPRPDGEHLAETWLRPDPLENQCAKDDSVRQVLRDRGDDGTRPRDTRLYFYGGDLEGLAEAAGEAGFRCEPTAQNDGLVLSADLPVDGDTFDGLTRTLLQWAELYDSEYDGWECALALN